MVLVDLKLAASRRAAWSRFTGELAAGGTIVAALAMLDRLTPSLNAAVAAEASGPALAGAMLAALWLAISKPGASHGLYQKPRAS